MHRLISTCLTVLLVTGWLLGQAHAHDADVPPSLPDLVVALDGDLTRSGACDRPVHLQLQAPANFHRLQRLDQEGPGSVHLRTDTRSADKEAQTSCRLLARS